MATINREQAASRPYLTFRLGDENFGVTVRQVREVLDLVPVTRVPQTPEFMLGVINLRGKVVPVVDLRRRFGMAPGESTQENCIVVMEVQVDGESAVVGAHADAVEEVLELDDEQIEPPPRMGTRLRTDFIQGMARKDERFLILLDIDKIFAAEEMELIQEVSVPTEEKSLEPRINSAGVEKVIDK